MLSIEKAEQNCGITNLNGLAEHWAVSHFEMYIHGMNFKIIMNHLALIAFKDKSLLPRKLLCKAKKLL